MKKETTFVLAGITAVMLGFIVLYEQHTLSSGELESRRGQVLERFVRPRVHGIRIERGDDVIVDLERDQQAEETLDTFDVGTWRLTAPVTGAADSDAIDGVLLACESISARRTIEHPSDEDRARFGLDAPRLVLTLEVADETQVVRVGADDEQLEGTYVEVVGTDRVHLVGQDFFEAIDQDTDHFRSKQLFPDLAVRDVTALSLTYAHEGADPTEARIALVDRRWVATVPFQGWARRTTVIAVIDALLDARVVRFAGEEGAALVESPRVTLALTTHERDVEGRDTGRLSEQRFVIGAPCPAMPVEDDATPDEIADAAVPLLAARVGDGPVTCVAEAALQTVLGSEPQLRETHLLAATDDQIERFVFGRATSGASEATLEVRRADDRWELRENETTRSADDAAVSEYLGLLHTSEAESFEPVTDALLAERGLATPRMRIRLHHSDDPEVVEYIDVGNEDTVGVWVRRGDEPVLARYVGEVAASLTPSSLRFRDRTVVSREADDVLRVTITRDGVEERLATENGAWRIEAPRALPADRIATRDLIRGLTSLRAVRWASDAEELAQGLASPRIFVHLELREASAPPSDDEGDEHDHDEDEATDEGPDAGAAPLPRTIDLRVGAVTEGGAFGRVEGEDAVFVIPTEILDALAHPLVDREIVSLDASNATRVTLTSPTGTTTIDRRDGAWWSGEALAAPDATDALLERLRSLRARSVAPYGAPPSFTTPRLSISIEGPGGNRRLDIGETTGEGVASAAPARASDLDAEVTLAGETVAAIASYRP